MNKMGAATPNFSDYNLQSSAFRRHPLGFYYSDRQAQIGISYRVHVWLEEQLFESQLETNHTHAFDLYSTIQIGRVNNSTFNFIVGEGEYRKHRVRYTEKGKQVSKITDGFESGKLLLKTSKTYGLNESYFVPAGEIHSTTVVSKPAVTFVKTTQKQNSCDVFGKQATEKSFKRSSVNLHERNEIENVLQKLK